MPTKKIRDILPPRRVAQDLPAEKEKKSEAPKFTPGISNAHHGRFAKMPAENKQLFSAPRLKGMFAFASFCIILLAGVAGVIVLHFVFATAEVSLWPNTREVEFEGRIVALPGEESLDPETLMIPALTISKEQEATRLFAATGKAMEAKKTQGTIRVFNGFSTFPQKLVANTRFLSEEGKLFRSAQAVVVPAGRMEGGKLVAGFLDIEVTAAEAGEEYNIGPSNFSLPGLFGNPAYTSIYGKSSEAMAGGLQEEVVIVTESDLTLARDALVEELKQDVREALQTEVIENMVLLPEAITLEVKGASSPVKPGARLDSFNFSATLKGFATIFSRQDVEDAVRFQVKDRMEEGEKLSSIIAVSYENVEMNTSSSVLSFDASASVLLYKEIDPVDLKAHLAGASREDAASLLSENSALERAEIVFFPPWLTSLPKDPDKVTIKLIID